MVLKHHIKAKRWDSIRRVFVLAAVAFLVVGFGSALAFNSPLLPKASSPEAVGLSSERLARIDRVIGKEIADKILPGAVIMVARKGKLAYTYVGGFQDPVKGTPMTGDSIFRIMSMTKPMVTVAAMTLMEEGKIALTDPVSKFFPALKKMQVSVPQKDAATDELTYKLVPAAREIRIYDLLRHTSGLTYVTYGGKNYVTYGGKNNAPQILEAYSTHKLTGYVPFLPRDQFIDAISKFPLTAHPATEFEYGLSVDLLGAVIEVVTGKRLAMVIEERIWKPLKMTDTSFWVDPQKQGRLVYPFPIDPSGSKTDLSGMDKPFAEPAFDSGGSGSLSTAGDYIRFQQMLLNGGTLDGVRILSRKSVELMTADHLDARITNHLQASEAALETLGYSFGLGFAIRIQPGMSGIPGSVGEFMWSGASGTTFWVDPKEELVAVYMSQHPVDRKKNRKLIRQLVHQAIID